MNWLALQAWSAASWLARLRVSFEDSITVRGVEGLVSLFVRQRAICSANICFRGGLMIRILTQAELEDFPSLEWPEIAPRISRQSRAALERVMETLDGGVLTCEQCALLANAAGDDLLGLLVAADALRRELVGNIVTYIVNRNINFTNVCFVGCKFCAFSRGPRESDTYFHSLEVMGRKAKEAWELGATEVCIQGGLPRDLPPFYYRDILRSVKSAAPGMHIHAFSPMEIM